MSGEIKDSAIQRLEFELHAGLSLTQRSFSLVGDVNEDMYLELDSKLSILESQSNGRERITVRINSCGGNVYDAMAMVARIRRSPAYIVTEGVGAIMSAATIILAAGKKRRMHSMASFMWHEFTAESLGTITQNRHQQSQIEMEFERWCEFMDSNTKMPESYWRERGRNGIDLYLTAKQCLEMGVVDEIF